MSDVMYDAMGEVETRTCVHGRTTALYGGLWTHYIDNPNELNVMLVGPNMVPVDACWETAKTDGTLPTDEDVIEWTQIALHAAGDERVYDFVDELSDELVKLGGTFTGGELAEALRAYLPHIGADEDDGAPMVAEELNRGIERR